VVFALEQFDEGYVFNLEYPDIKEALTKSPLPPFSKRGTLKHISQTIAKIRASKLPDWEKIGTAGSFFANPIVDIQHFEILKKDYPEMPFWEITSIRKGGSDVGAGDFVNTSSQQNPPFSPLVKGAVKLSAGRLIEKAGLKGYSNGKAGTSPNHALIVINE
jgi:UDP-N-acetylmuramate dehydrogenase